jgi:hypothetical protein
VAEKLKRSYFLMVAQKSSVVRAVVPIAVLPFNPYDCGQPLRWTCDFLAQWGVWVVLIELVQGRCLNGLCVFSRFRRASPLVRDLFLPREARLDAYLGRGRLEKSK